MKKSFTVLTSIATPFAVVAVGAMVYQASYAAFTGTTNNTGNEWSTGSINLTDDDNGVALFRVSDLLPGSSMTRCIEVTANASAPSQIKGYTVSPDISNAKGLQDRIKMTIQSGDGGTFATCSGFTPVGPATVTEAPLSHLMTNVKDWNSAAGVWAVPGGATPAKRTYQVTYKFDTGGMTQQQIDGLQGARVGVGLQWEMRTNEG